MSDRTQPIFISYASQDAEAARRICQALSDAGIDVWFDQSELRGGDTWDTSIRQQIKDCSLFVPIISSHTQERAEGYFRREWNLAVSRTLDMAQDQAFLLPVVVDATADSNARVPEKFREVQWTRLPDGHTSASFIEHVHRLLLSRTTDLPLPADSVHIPRSGLAAAASGERLRAPADFRRKWGWLAVGVAAALIVVVAAVLWQGKHFTAPLAVVPEEKSADAKFAPPAHSIAVLPFVNLSGDPKQDYFSDGLSEELLNSLATVHELQVAARTSSFSFKGTNATVARIARELNVGAVLEGSVRKEGNHVRITAELINAVTGFDQWTQSYDRDLKNILSLQTEIATEVTRELQASLLPGTSVSFELGGTRDPAAFDAYLRGESLAGLIDETNLRSRIADYDEAIRKDPLFAKAYAGRSLAVAVLAGNGHVADYADAQATAEKAVALAPKLGRAHTVLGYALFGRLDVRHALVEHERALELSPGDSFVLQYSGAALAVSNRPEGLIAAQRAVTLDPLNATSYFFLGASLVSLHKYEAAIEALSRAATLSPNLDYGANSDRGWAYIQLGKFDAAVKACLTPPIFLNNYVCLAIAYQKLGQASEAQAALRHLQDAGDQAAWQMAEVYASWGDTETAVRWLQTALRLRDPGLGAFRTDPTIDSVRSDPRVQAIARELDFPD